MALLAAAAAAVDVEEFPSLAAAVVEERHCKVSQRKAEHLRAGRAYSHLVQLREMASLRRTRQLEAEVDVQSCLLQLDPMRALAVHRLRAAEQEVDRSLPVEEVDDRTRRRCRAVDERTLDPAQRRTCRVEDHRAWAAQQQQQLELDKPPFAFRVPF